MSLEENCETIVFLAFIPTQTYICRVSSFHMEKLSTKITDGVIHVGLFESYKVIYLIYEVEIH